MEVEIVFVSDHFDHERGNYFQDNRILFYWDCKILPEKGDLFGQGFLEKILTPTLLEELEGLMWSLQIIEWEFKDEKILPVLWLEGE